MTELRQSSATKELFDRDFTLRYTVTLLRASLHVSLSVIADSHGDVLPFQALLHSYLRLPSAVRPPQVRVKGFNALKLRDKLQGGAESNEDREIVTVDGPGGEVDRVYFGAPDTLEVTYEGAPGGMTVNKEALADAVVSFIRIELSSSVWEVVTTANYLNRSCPYCRCTANTVVEPRREGQQHWRHGRRWPVAILLLRTGTSWHVCRAQGWTILGV